MSGERLLVSSKDSADMSLWQRRSETEVSEQIAMGERRVVEMPIMPVEQVFAHRPGDDGLNYKAIAVYTCLGFFLGEDTFFRNKVALQPGHRYTLDSGGRVISDELQFAWHYSPRSVSLKQVVEEFAELFEQIVNEQTKGKRVILPLSGGLDSRTQAAALRSRAGSVTSYSYEFMNGIPEVSYGQKIAECMGFSFHRMTVGTGYLWDCVEQLAAINGCCAEFTHPRQMAFIDRYASFGDVFSLGHWGDVFFDDMRVPENLGETELTQAVSSKVTKRSGFELANALWQMWGLPGKFEEYLEERIGALLNAIHIQDANARIRAFKSLYWAPRWTSVNLQVFSAVKPITLPYYDDRMCRYVCTVPEQWLARRRIQIEYLKMVAPELARIPWQAHAPFNLYNYQWNRVPWNLPIRVYKKFVNRYYYVAKNSRLVQRNWELQFAGEENDRHLRYWLFENKKLHELVSAEVIKSFYDKFRNCDSRSYAHAISMLLTLSLFCHRRGQTGSHDK